MDIRTFITHQGRFKKFQFFKIKNYFSIKEPSTKEKSYLIPTKIEGTRNEELDKLEPVTSEVGTSNCKSGKIIFID